MCFCFAHFLIDVLLSSVVLKPHLLFEAQLVDGKSHEFGPITCPEQPEPPSSLSGINIGKQKHDAELKYPRRLRRLNIFPASKAEVTSHSSIAGTSQLRNPCKLDLKGSPHTHDLILPM